MIIKDKKLIFAFDALMLGGAFTYASHLATQYAAGRFQYHESLGAPWWDNVYAPWSWIAWEMHYQNQGPETFTIINGGMIAFSLVMLFTYWSLFKSRSMKPTKHTGIFGTARWAKEKDIRQTGLLPHEGPAQTGVYVGGWRKGKTLYYMRHDGPEHVLAIAPTRSGKGVGLVIPTLLTWPGSVVIHDMKGELWELTAGCRSESGIVLRFDPAAEKGSCTFNPLEEVRIDSLHAVADVQNLANIIVDPDGKGLIDHWKKTSHAFLTGLILHLLLRDGKASLWDVAYELSNPKRPIDALYKEMVECWDPDDKVRQVIAAAGQDMINRPEQERGSVLSTAMSYLNLYRDPIIAENTRTSSFRIQDLMRNDWPVSLYLVVDPDNLDRLKPLMRLMLNQIIRVSTREKMNKGKASYKHRLLLMLDEFPAFGKLDVFQGALAWLAGYGIKAYLITQDITQLKDAYGPNESISSNCHVQIAYAPNNTETAEWLSKKLGQSTVVEEEISNSGKRMELALNKVTKTFRAFARPLMTPGEVSSMKGMSEDCNGNKVPGQMLVFVAGHPPIKGTQILYFQDANFQKWAEIDAPLVSEIIWEDATVKSDDVISEKPIKKTDRPEKPNPSPTERKGVVQTIGHDAPDEDEKKQEVVLSQ